MDDQKKGGRDGGGRDPGERRGRRNIRDNVSAKMNPHSAPSPSIIPPSSPNSHNCRGQKGRARKLLFSLYLTQGNSINRKTNELFISRGSPWEADSPIHLSCMEVEKENRWRGRTSPARTSIGDAAISISRSTAGRARGEESGIRLL